MQPRPVHVAGYVAFFWPLQVQPGKCLSCAEPILSAVLGPWKFSKRLPKFLKPQACYVLSKGGKSCDYTLNILKTKEGCCFKQMQHANAQWKRWSEIKSDPSLLSNFARACPKYRIWKNNFTIHTHAHMLTLNAAPASMSGGEGVAAVSGAAKGTFPSGSLTSRFSFSAFSLEFSLLSLFSFGFLWLLSCAESREELLLLLLGLLGVRPCKESPRQRQFRDFKRIL